MKISYLGHSSFLLVSNGGTRIVTDPFGDIGYAFPHVSADFVTVSHGHYDHAEVAAVEGRPAVADKAGSYNFGDVKAQAIACWHDDAGGRKRGSNLAFCFTADGITVCHLGDIGQACEAAFVKKLGKIDVLMLPVGGVYTVDAVGAKAYVDAIEPGIVIPMHYKTTDLNIPIAGIEHFLKLFPDAPISREGALSVNGPSDGKKIVVMERVK